MRESRSAEDFLKAVFVLEQQAERVSTNALADALNVKAPSVTDMARRLESSGLLNYQKYHGVWLTDAGRAVALKVLRRHRLIELYLVEELGYALHEVHDEAEILEHNVSERFIEAIASKMDHPDVDPHGDPIPDASGEMIQRELTRLSEIDLNTPATVARFLTEENAMLEYILDRGLLLNAQVEVVERDPFEGPVTLLIDGERQVVGHNIATSVWVEPQP